MAKSLQAEIDRLIATGMTEEQARETAEYDLAVENGEETEYDLTPEQQKVAKKYTSTGTKKKSPNYQFSKRERKPNEVKREIMAQIHKLFRNIAESGSCEDVNLSNPERTLDFTWSGKAYTLTLTEHRPKK